MSSSKASIKIYSQYQVIFPRAWFASTESCIFTDVSRSGIALTDNCLPSWTIKRLRDLRCHLPVLDPKKLWQGDCQKKIAMSMDEVYTAIEFVESRCICDRTVTMPMILLSTLGPTGPLNTSVNLVKMPQILLLIQMTKDRPEENWLAQTLWQDEWGEAKLQLILFSSFQYWFLVIKTTMWHLIDTPLLIQHERLGWATKAPAASN